MLNNTIGNTIIMSHDFGCVVVEVNLILANHSGYQLKCLVYSEEFELYYDVEIMIHLFSTLLIPEDYSV